MRRLILDAEFRSTLNGLTSAVELCDEAGRTVGRFLPEGTYRQLVHGWLRLQSSDEELERISGEPGGSTLAEIWKRLGRT
jgi:hypothetical protein